MPRAEKVVRLRLTLNLLTTSKRFGFIQYFSREPFKKNKNVPSMQKILFERSRWNENQCFNEKFIFVRLFDIDPISIVYFFSSVLQWCSWWKLKNRWMTRHAWTFKFNYYIWTKCCLIFAQLTIYIYAFAKDIYTCP